MIAKIVTKIGRLRAFPRVAVYMRNEAKHRDVIFLFKDTVQLESAVGVDVIQQERFKLNPCCFYNECLVSFPVYRCLIGRLEIGQWVLFTLLCW